MPRGNDSTAILEFHAETLSVGFSDDLGGTGEQGGSGKTVTGDIASGSEGSGGRSRAGNGEKGKGGGAELHVVGVMDKVRISGEFFTKSCRRRNNKSLHVDGVFDLVKRRRAT